MVFWAQKNAALRAERHLLRERLRIVREKSAVSGFYQESAFANAGAQVVKFSATNFAAVGDFDLCDPWCVDWEYTLNAFAVGNFTNGERSVYAGSAHGDNNASKNLNPLFAAFDNAGVNLNGIAYAEFGNVLFQLLLLDFFDDVHVARKGKF